MEKRGKKEVRRGEGEDGREETLWESSLCRFHTGFLLSPLPFPVPEERLVPQLFTSHNSLLCVVFFSFNRPSRPAERIFILCAGEARYFFFFFRNSTCRSGSAPSFIRKLGTRTKCFVFFLLFTNQEQTTDVIRGGNNKKLSNNTFPLRLISPSHASIFSPSLCFSSFTFLPPPRLRLQSPHPSPLCLFWFFFPFLSEVGRVGGWRGRGGSPCLSVWLGKLPARRAPTSLWVLADFIIFIIGRLPPWQSH